MQSNSSERIPIPFRRKWDGSYRIPQRIRQFHHCQFRQPFPFPLPEYVPNHDWAIPIQLARQE